MEHGTGGDREGGAVAEARGEGRRERRHRSRGLPTDPGLFRSLALFLGWLVLAVGITWGALLALDAWIT